MGTKSFLRKSLLLILMAMVEISAEAKINMGTINMKVGDTEQVFAEPSTYYTVSGSWSRTGGNAIYISARSQRSCTITAINAGTATLEWEGLINATWAEMYWTVNVSGGGDNPGSGGSTSDPNEPTDKWNTSGNYSITWYNNNKSEFTLTTSQELAGLAYLVNNGYSDFSGKTIKIGEDISLSGKSWASIGKTNDKYFNGTFDGQGHIIGGLYVGRQDENQLYFGFFGYLGSKSVVRNIVLQGEVNVFNPVYTDTKYQGSHYVGGLAGNCKSTSVENCKIEMHVQYSRNVPNGGNVFEINVGGLFGRCDNGIIRYCSHVGNVSCLQTPSNAGYNDVALPYVGGLIGYYSGSSIGNSVLEYCENLSTTIILNVPNNSKSTNHLWIGGLFGRGFGKVQYCRNICNFDITHNGFPYAGTILAYVGGIGGQSAATTINCYSSVPKTIINSTRINEVHYSGIGGNSSTSKANYSNSDASIQTSIQLTREYDGSTSFTSEQMKTNSFLDELNVYAQMNLGKKIWISGMDGYPSIASSVILVEKIKLSESNLSLSVGDTKQISATITPSNATNKDVTWSSNNTSIATVSSSGLVTAKAAGTATITCKANDGSGVSATCDVVIKSVGIDINATNFPDENFRKYLLEQNYGKDGVITETELGKITSVSVGSKDIKTLKGIEHFTALTDLSCQGNQLTALDVSKNTVLTDLWCDNNLLTALDVSKNTALTDLFCQGNQLTALDVSKNTALTELSCANNKLTSLDVSKNTTLTYINCANNKLTSLDVSKNHALTNLTCAINQIKEEAMDILIQGLPTNKTNNIYPFTVYQAIHPNEGNVFTKTQAMSAKAKGWTPLYYNGTEWVEYEGYDDTPTAISLPTSVRINVDETIALKPTLTPKDAKTTLSWGSDDTSIAKVSQSGIVMGIKEGTAIVSVTTSNNLKAECFVVVKDPAGINDVEMDNASNLSIYTLSGQRLSKPRKGINIIDGKKVVLK